MKTARRQAHPSRQQGSIILIAACIFAVVLLTGFAIWYVVSNDTDTASKTNTTTTPDSSSQQPATDQSSSLLTVYQSTRGGFTLQYPKSWIISGYKSGQKVDKLAGDEDHVRFQSASETTSKVDNFGADLTISPTAPGDTAWPTYPNGSIVEELKNGIDVWEDNQVQTLATGRKENTCPSVRAAANSAFGFQLKNGTWLAVNGSFCWSPGLTTSYSYAQQRDSTQFGQTIEILRSIVQN